MGRFMNSHFDLCFSLEELSNLSVRELRKLLREKSHSKRDKIPKKPTN